MKSKEFGRPGGACVPHAPPRSANGYSCQSHIYIFFLFKVPCQMWICIKVYSSKFITNLLPFEVVQKCQHFQLCVSRENPNETIQTRKSSKEIVKYNFIDSWLCVKCSHNWDLDQIMKVNVQFFNGKKVTYLFVLVVNVFDVGVARARSFCVGFLVKILKRDLIGCWNTIFGQKHWYKVNIPGEGKKLSFG